MNNPPPLQFKKIYEYKDKLYKTLGLTLVKNVVTREWEEWIKYETQDNIECNRPVAEFVARFKLTDIAPWLSELEMVTKQRDEARKDMQGLIDDMAALKDELEKCKSSKGSA